MLTLEDALERLRRFYGLLPPPPGDPFTLFVWEVLSVHSVPAKRDASLAQLKRIRALTPDAMWRAPRKTLDAAVAHAGPYVEQRLRALKIGVDRFRRSPELPSTIRGPVVAARRALIGLPQMGEGGAYRMLLFAADHPVLPVDARLARVVRRLGFVAEEKDFARTARSIRKTLGALLQPDVERYRRTYLYLSHHGATTCTEASPHCAVCPLREECPAGRSFLAHEGTEAPRH